MKLLTKEAYEWALLHIMQYYDSDFFPTLFEYKAIKQNWVNILPHLLQLDLTTYAPQTPYVALAQKPNGTYRIVHQLDPIDSIIYTAFAYENTALIENARVPIDRKIACSYRFKPDSKGSFFEKNNLGYADFWKRNNFLAHKHINGYVLVTDIVDFYNQIYLHRVSNVLSEMGSSNHDAFEKFLLGLNSNVSKGIPIGPVASIVVSEAILSDIDDKLLRHTENFTRYVDDINIFFNTKDEAQALLHELTFYLHSNHRLVLSSEKTRIITSRKFIKGYLNNEKRLEKETLHEKVAIIEKYPRPEALADFDKLPNDRKLKIRSEAYKDLFKEAIEFDKIDLGLMRHILRQAGRYKIRSIIPQIFESFDRLIPVIRDLVVYFNRVLNDRSAIEYESQFSNLLDKPYLSNPYVNIWIFTLFQNLAFNCTKIKIDYAKIIRVREKALIARRSNEKTWVKEMKDSIDVLGPWDKRALIHSSIVLSSDESRHWLGLTISKGDILERSICLKVLHDKKGE